MRRKGLKTRHRQAVAGVCVGDDPDIVAKGGLLSRKIEHVAEQPADRRAQAMQNTERLSHGSSNSKREQGQHATPVSNHSSVGKRAWPQNHRS
jgi:hypothetical protein